MARRHYRLPKVKRARTKGQALLEFAFILPILVALAIGVIELGRYAYLSILVGNAARAGAAFGAENPGYSNDQTRIQLAANADFLNNGQNISTLNVTSTVTCGCDSNGTISPDTNNACFPSTPPTCPALAHWVITVHVTATGQFNALFNYPGIPNPLNVSKTAFMRAAN